MLGNALCLCEVLTTPRLCVCACLDHLVTTSLDQAGECFTSAVISFHWNFRNCVCVYCIMPSRTAQSVPPCVLQLTTNSVYQAFSFNAGIFSTIQNSSRKIQNNPIWNSNNRMFVCFFFLIEEEIRTGKKKSSEKCKPVATRPTRWQ